MYCILLYHVLIVNKVVMTSCPSRFYANFKPVTRDCSAIVFLYWPDTDRFDPETENSRVSRWEYLRQTECKSVSLNELNMLRSLSRHGSITIVIYAMSRKKYLKILNYINR